jgi:hypothetical protein
LELAHFYFFFFFFFSILHFSFYRKTVLSSYILISLIICLSLRYWYFVHPHQVSKEMGPRRAHKKSRNGCRWCKARKVKVR